MPPLKTYEGFKERFEEMQDLSFDCYRTDPQLFGIIDSLVRLGGMLTESAPETYVRSQLETAYNGLKKYKEERMSSL
ncbi:hypothetical protein P9314_16175 [Paenibacillus validus]|uniref:Uncharacterized protein n=1 Tax=Paenibacillus validus TaxID=44253 RepID=A0A7X3CSP9_9BACL|nr:MULTISPECIES: hypothetical protein [Paenibacillus]MED4602224.1 hypothetical protein [Paenibacillus validus]MED4607390.1 hypothetical protein [Paenibacillus validus]MUG70224.1 hypothetical protein [Paenibacillus validus]